MHHRDREHDRGEEARTPFQRWIETPHPNTTWALTNLAGLYDDPVVYIGKILDATGRNCRVVGGSQVVPLPLGHQMAISVVPVTRAHLFPVNGRATAIFQNRAPSQDEHKASPAPRWGLGKPIITNIAAAAAVRFVKVTVRQPEAYYWKAEVFGYCRTVQGVREMTAERDCDFRDSSPQLQGKSTEAIAQLRATGARKAATGAKLRAIRETLAIDHAVWDFEIDLPFVFAAPIFTGRDKDPAVQALLAKGILEMAASAQTVLWGQASGRPAPALAAGALAGGSSAAPALLVAPPSSDHGVGAPAAPSLFDDDCLDEGAAPPALPPKPPPPPLQAGDPKRIRLPGRDMPAIADAGTDQLLASETRERRGLLEGTWKPEFAEQNARRLLTMREELVRRRGEKVPPCPELDQLVAESKRASAAAA
jgi:hypothetical protein